MTCETCWLPTECGPSYCKAEHKSMTSGSNGHKCRFKPDDDTPETRPHP